MAPNDTKPPGTYREEDGSPVPFAEALAAWVPLAYDELIVTAGTYNAVTTYQELSGHVRQASGIQTRQLLTNWVGKLLEAVAERARAAGEPPLTSLCVHQDGTIGPGYAREPKSATDDPAEDIEHYAARHRLLCYRKYATDLPEDGGRPALTRAESQRRERKAKQAREQAPVKTCPSCNMQLLSSGVCGYCG
jgi:ribosomal protein L32